MSVAPLDVGGGFDAAGQEKTSQAEAEAVAGPGEADVRAQAAASGPEPPAREEPAPAGAGAAPEDAVAGPPAVDEDAVMREAAEAVARAVPSDEALRGMDLTEPLFWEADFPPVREEELGLAIVLGAEDVEFDNEKSTPVNADDHAECCQHRPHRLHGDGSVSGLWESDPKLAPNTHGVVMCSSAAKGRRKYNEDTHACLYGDPAPGEIRAIFGIFDGHGGDQASKIVRSAMSSAVQEAINLCGPNVGRALGLSFRFLERELLRCSFERSFESGTTAVVHALVGDTLFTANVGDCRSVLCRNGRGIQLTRDHKPSCPRESERIIRNGGSVSQKTVERPRLLCCGAVRQVPVGPSRVSPGGLAVARTLGDVVFKLPGLRTMPQYGIVTASPEVSAVRLTASDEFVITASDGFWDVIKNDEAIRLLHRQLHQGSYEAAVRHLVDRALAKGSHDNTTVTVCFFTHHDGPWAAPAPEPGAQGAGGEGGER